MIDLTDRIDALDDDERMIRDAAADFCGRDAGFQRMRALRGRLPGHEGSAWREMAAMGWLGCALPEQVGGSALTHRQQVLLLEQYGGSLAPEPLTAVAILAARVLLDAADEATRARHLPELAAGNWLPAVAWQERAGEADARPIATRAVEGSQGFVIDGRKRFVPAGESASHFIVSALIETTGGDEAALFLLPADVAGLVARPEPRIDGGSWTELSLDAVKLAPEALLARGERATQALEAALDAARLAASAELLGAMSRLFETTVDYLRTREQFGRPIGSFQSLQHRAVDLLILVELSRAVVRDCAGRFDAAGSAAERALAASQAKARCSDAALTVAKGCVQLHGGIAYTDECHVGLFLKRIMVLAGWLGDAAWHRARYGRLAEARGLDETRSTDSDDPLLQELGRWLADSFPQAWRFPDHRMSLQEAGSWLAQLADKGWTAPGWPTEHGGMGLSAWEQMRFQDVFDRHGVSLAPNMGVTMLGPLLIRHGTEAQKRRYLPDILSGRTRWCQGYSEPGAGSDLAALRTRAELRGDEHGEHFVVNGQKIWTSFAHEADMIFLLVRTDPEARKQDGISFLLVDMKSPGITVRRIRNLTGESEFCEVFFDNVRVPRENLVGEMNRGWSMAKSLLGSERIMIGSPKLARYPLQQLRKLLQTRDSFDAPLLRARYDALCLDVDDLGAAFVRMAEVLRRGGALGPEVSMLKIWVTETMQRVTDLMLEVGAEEALLDEALPLPDGTRVHVANQYFASRPATIYGGSSEIQRNILAKGLLGLP